MQLERFSGKIVIEVKDLVKKLLIHCLIHETRVALLEDDKLAEYLIERPIEKRIISNIYKGRIANVLPGMEAAFVDIGLKKNAFLYVDDIYPSKGIKKGETEHAPTIQEVVSERDEVLVQVSKEAVGNKGPRVTSNITIPGRYLVYLPFGAYVGISRRIQEELERERLKEIGDAHITEKEGLIIRTVCEGVSEQELVDDLEQLRERWRDVAKVYQQAKTPELIYQEVDMIPRVVRDLMTTDITSCIIDDGRQFKRLQQELSAYPELKERIHLYSGKEPIFDHYLVRADIERALKRKVWLKSGGYIIIEETEALTVVDVNTGKFTGDQNLEETVLQTNVEAAKEIARQLRLRDIGGIIIIDFIDMSLEESRLAVLDKLEAALKLDRTKTNLIGLTPLGLVELTRKKVKQSLLEVLSKPCPHCEGKGYIVLDH